MGSLHRHCDVHWDDPIHPSSPLAHDSDRVRQKNPERFFVIVITAVIIISRKTTFSTERTNGGEIRTGQTGFPIGLLFGRVNHVACLLFQSCLLFHYLSHERLDWIFGTPPHPLCFGNGYSTNHLWGTHLSKRKHSLYPTLPYKQHQIYPKQH